MRSLLSQRLHAGLRPSRSRRVKTFLHHLVNHFITSPWVSLNPRCVVGQCRYKEGKREEEGERERTLVPSAVLGAKKDSPAPSLHLPLCLPVFPTYFPLLTAILKNSPHSFCIQATLLTAIYDSSSQSTAACSKPRRELVSRLLLHKKLTLISRILQRTI